MCIAYSILVYQNPRVLWFLSAFGDVCSFYFDYFRNDDLGSAFFEIAVF